MGEPVTVARFDTAPRAHVALALLESEGITAALFDEHFVQMDPLLSRAAGGIKLVVAGADAIAARTVLEEARDPAATAETCPACGSLDVTEHKGAVRAAWLSLLLLGIPIGRTRSRFACDACRHSWKG